MQLPKESCVHGTSNSVLSIQERGALLLVWLSCEPSFFKKKKKKAYLLDEIKIYNMLSSTGI